MSVVSRSALPVRRPRLGGRFRISPGALVYEGNHVRLLCGGAEYFPALIGAIEASRREVHLETYLFEPDAIGNRVAEVLAAAARRGVAVRVMIDGYGGGEFARRLVAQLGTDGARVRIYRPQRWWRLERRLLRRLHRKMVLIDDTIGFVGGINIIDDNNHRVADGDELGPRFDFAVACEGPIVAAIGRALKGLWWRGPIPGTPRQRRRHRRLQRQPVPPPFPDGVPASLLLRDNLRNRRTIERAYIEAIAGARREVLITSAYFVPGHRFRAALAAAAARGVRVRLLLQGRIEYWLQHMAQEALYGRLLADGIEINVYERSFLHAKAAVIDDDWATVGSSNIDPFSLLLAREANLCVRDRAFAARLRGEIEAALASSSQRLDIVDYQRRPWWSRLARRVALAVMRLAVVALARHRDY